MIPNRLVSLALTVAICAVAGGITGAVLWATYPSSVVLPERLSAAEPIREPEPAKETPMTSKKDQAQGGPSSPTVTQGPGSIAQFGDNNTATINNTPPPWVLSPDQHQAIVEVLRSHRAIWDGKWDVIICVLGDPDSTRMAESFVEVFRAAGWALPGSGYAKGGYTEVPVGIRIIVAKDYPMTESFMTFARALSGAFKRAGLISDALDIVKDDGHVAGFSVEVGRRPR